MKRRKSERTGIFSGLITTQRKITDEKVCDS